MTIVNQRHGVARRVVGIYPQWHKCRSGAGEARCPNGSPGTPLAKGSSGARGPERGQAVGALEGSGPTWGDKTDVGPERVHATVGAPRSSAKPRAELELSAHANDNETG
jgi:hypothetical protein